jgi:hypothetical protein
MKGGKQMYKILSTGEIITNLREKIKASQNDIKGTVTRNYISVVEHDKTIPNNNTLVNIYNNISKIAKENNIDLPFSLDDLMRTDEEKIQAVCNQILSDIKIYKMKKNTKDSLNLLTNNINSFITKYRVNDLQQCEIYENMADLYLNENMQYESKVYCVKTFELAIRSNNYEYALRLIYTMTNVLMKINKDELISFLGNYAYLIYDRAENKNNDIFKRIFFNAAKANKHIGNMEECMVYIKLIEDKFVLTSTQKYELKILKGDCYSDLCNYSQAESTFLSLLNEATEIEDSNVVALTYINLAEIKLKTDNKAKSREYLAKACEFKVDERYESTIKYLSLKLYIGLDELNSVNKLYDEVIKLLVKDKDEKSLYLILDNIVEYLILKREIKPLNIIVNMVYNYIMKDEIKNRNVSEVLFKIVNYMLDIDIDTAKNISNLCVKCTEKFKQNVN